MTSEKPGGYGRYKDDANHIGCPRARSDMTPCIARDGHTALDVSECVGCGERPHGLDGLLQALRHEVTGRSASPVTIARHAADKLRDLVRKVTAEQLPAAGSDWDSPKATDQLDEETEKLRNALLARDYWARDVVFHHELAGQPGDDHFATIAKALIAARAQRDALLPVAEAARAVDHAWRKESGTGTRVVAPLRVLAAAVDEWQRTQTEAGNG